MNNANQTFKQIGVKSIISIEIHLLNPYLRDFYLYLRLKVN